MIYVVDASVAIKWFVQESLHERALDLFDHTTRLLAPDFIAAEVTNAAWKKCIRGEITRQQAQTIAAGIGQFFFKLHPATELNEAALQIGLTLNHPIYDCLYIACAEANEGILVTDDQRLVKAVGGTGFASSVCPLRDFHPDI